MNIEGLDYNTQRERLVLPEYGREIQNMVNYCLTLTDRQERQNCAESIVDIMERMIPQNHTDEDYKQKLWDHLAIMSNFQLDIDYPYDVSQAARIATNTLHRTVDASTSNHLCTFRQLVLELLDLFLFLLLGLDHKEPHDSKNGHHHDNHAHAATLCCLSS